MSEQENINPRPQRSVGRFLLYYVLAMSLGFLVIRHCAEQNMFVSEFGASPGQTHPLAIQSRLQALCYDYIAATARAEAAKQTVIPGTLPGSAGEKEQFLKDATERLTKERAEYSRRYFIIVRRLAESEGPLPDIDGCRELITIEE